MNLMGIVIAASSGGALVGVLMVVGAIVIVLLIRLWVGSLDQDRIREHVEQDGKQICSINWEPFGRGWFGSKNERIYSVVFKDASGNVHEAYCKTSLFSGVYWTEDNVVENAANGETAAEVNDLYAENERLRAELARLKRN